jgi:hypothetical protein
MLYEKENKFFATIKNIGDVQFKFIRDEERRVEQAIINIGFARLRLDRIK